MTFEREVELRVLFRDLQRGASVYAEQMRQQSGLEIMDVVRAGFELIKELTELQVLHEDEPVHCGGCNRCQGEPT